METIAIPSTTDSQKAPIIECARAILADPDSPEIPRLEEELNQLIYIIYQLTSDEIKIIDQ
jgi:hypothetical protein